MISTRPKSPSRPEAIALALRPQPVFGPGVLIGNWVEDKIECPKQGTFYFPPKEVIDYEKLKPESRQPDFRFNKLYGLRGNLGEVYKHDSHQQCGNFITTTDLVYTHQPKPLCGPVQRYYRKCKHQWYPQPDNMECFGNKTEWGLKKYKEHEWACTDVSDYAASVYDDTYVPPRPQQYLHPCERKARNSNFTKGFRFLMTKPLAKPKQKKKQCNWVEDKIECPKQGTFYFPPKEVIDYEKLKPESRQPDFRFNKLYGLRGNLGEVYKHDSHQQCGNFITTTDLVYTHQPKPLCGPVQRYYRKCKHQWYPQPDNMECFGNKTEWGLKKYKEHEWACTDVSDYAASVYDDTYVPPRPQQYLHPCERKARNSNFTKGFRFLMTKPLAKPKQKKKQ